MCGINGIIGFNSSVSRSDIESMNNAIKHRGPDDEGIFVFNSKEFSIGLGHRRLSILDLTERGHQPMGYDIKRDKIIYKDSQLNKADIVIVYNGEIYNYLELKEKFKLETETKTDTEIILRLYNKLGKNCVNYFNGMWAFCIFDKRNKIVFCSRDRFGIKPLYYYWDGASFIFSSEVKGILAVKRLNKKENINKKALRLYFSLGFIPSPYTIYKKTFKLEPRQNLILDLLSHKIKTHKFWQPPDYSPIYNKKELMNKIKDLLYDAVRLRMRSDVPVGAFLSGGLDSSTIVSLMRNFTNLKKLHTFSIGFEGIYDETRFMNIVVDHLKTKHHHRYFKEKNFEELLDLYPWIYDEPFADYSGFPTYEVSKMARKYVKVVLSGDGGDEIFGGYENHLNAQRILMLKALPKFIRKLLLKLIPDKFVLLKEAIKLSLSHNKLFYSHMLETMRYKPKVYKRWMEKNLDFSLLKSKNNLANAVILNDLLFLTLPDHFLVKVDRASMANSIEVRTPFLDYRLVELSQQIPIEWKTDIFKTKKLMREIIKNLLPRKIVNRNKQGFHPPLDLWLSKRKIDYKKMADKLYSERLLTKDIYTFLLSKVINKENPLMFQYVARLFLYHLWVKKWIENA